MAKSDTSSDNTDSDYSLTSNHIVIVSHSVFISRPWQAEEERVNSITETTKEDLESIPEVLPELKKTYFFGCGPCHPQWLQIFASKKFFTLILCFSTLLQGAIVSGLAPVTISTLEKQYNFASTESGVLFGIYDATIAVSIIFITYFGGKTHKPRFIGISIIIVAMGAFVFALPQFIFGTYASGNFNSTLTVDLEECSDIRNNTNEDCSSANYGAYTIFLFGRVILGIGYAPTLTIAPAYLDEIISPKYISIYIGIFSIPTVVGPAIGFGLGSAFLSVYVDPWINTYLTPTDPTWVGAWWIGYIVIGVLLLIIAIPFLMFPRYLPDSYLVQQERAKEMAKVYSSDYVNENNLTIVVKMFPVHIKRLLLNPSFILVSFGLAFSILVRDGVVGFGAKYFETMFDLTATTSGLLSGGLAITCAVMGVLTGSLIIHLCKLNGRQAGAILWVALLLCIPTTFLYFLKCPSLQVAGITVPYADGSQNGQDSSICAQQCECTSNLFEPVCGADDLTYFSPCRAGCLRTFTKDEEYHFNNCTCVMESFVNSTSVNNNILANALNGNCDTNCNKLWIYFVFLGFFIYLLLVIHIPNLYATLRVVSDEQRHLALGVQAFIYRTFGSIPGGVLFGVMFDVSCITFNYECGIRGNCWIYDNNKLGLYTFSLVFPCVVIAFILFLFHWILYPKQHASDEVAESTVYVNTNKQQSS